MNPEELNYVVKALGVHDDRQSLPLGNKADPFDELIYIILTTMTQYGASKAFEEMQGHFARWDDLLLPDAEPRLRSVISRSGLVNQKSPQILSIARKVKQDFGCVTLAPLRDMTDDEAENYLLSLPRVGKKVARCVLMYSLNRDVLPVDAHVLRVSRRIGLLPEDVPWQKAHDAIHEVVPPELRYAVHVGLVQHGRTICVHKTPKCPECLLKYVCPSSNCRGPEEDGEI